MRRIICFSELLLLDKKIKMGNLCATPAKEAGRGAPEVPVVKKEVPVVKKEASNASMKK